MSEGSIEGPIDDRTMAPGGVEDPPPGPPSFEGEHAERESNARLPGIEEGPGDERPL